LIADVLDMTIEEALKVFENVPRPPELQTLVDVGLGYCKLGGQKITTLSGGEAQRVKLAAELSQQGRGKTLYLIDEPTTGLSFYDVHHLLDVLQRLVDKGNSIIVIEHNLDVIRCSDWIIDSGRRGIREEIIAVGTPETVAKCERILHWSLSCSSITPISQKSGIILGKNTRDNKANDQD